MSSSHVHSTLQFGIYILLSSAITLYALNRISRWRSRMALAKANNCEKAPHIPHKDPFFGLDHYFETVKAFNEHRYALHLRQELEIYGPTYQYSSIDGENIVTKDPMNIRSVLSADFESYGVQEDRYLPLKPIGGENFFTCDGPIWRHSRDMIKPALYKNEYSDMSRMEVYVQRFLDLIPRDGSTVDVIPLVSRLMQDYMSFYLFNKSMDSMTLHPNVDQKGITEAFETALLESTNRFFLVSLIGNALDWIPLGKKFSAACKTAQEFIDNAVSEAFRLQASTEKSASKSKDPFVFIHDIITRSTDRLFLRNLVMVMYVGATDTSAVATSHIIFALSRNKRVLQKLREEILGLDALDLGSIQKLPYLKAVINETLRMYPIAGFSNRTCTRDTVLPTGGGPDGTSPVLVKKGMSLWLTYKALHYDPAIFGADVDEFRPERWFEIKPQQWEFVPFGGGGRACPGQHLAQANMAYIIVRLLQEFKDIQSRDDRPWTEELKLVMTNRNGVHVAFTPT